MKRFLVFLMKHLGALLIKHRDQVILAITTVLKWIGAAFFSHLAIRHSVLDWWQWIAEPLAVMLFGIGGYVWSALEKRWSQQRAVAATRLAVADASGCKVEDVPDSVHTNAISEVNILNKNGGVPPPNEV